MLLLAFAIGGYFVVLFGAVILQERFIYLNLRTKPQNPSDVGLAEVTAQTVSMQDGQRLQHWRAPAQEGMPTLIYFHGNKETLAWRATRFRTILDAGYGLSTFAYRGYSGSTGRPQEQTIYSDALAIYDETKRITEGPLVIYGESLGTAVATYVATKRSAVCVVLEAPFTSMVDMAARYLPIWPVSVYIRHRFPSFERIASINKPLLILHGTRDRIVPIRYGRRLFDAAVEPKEMTVFDGAGHINLWKYKSFDAVTSFVKQHMVRANEPKDVS